MGLVVRDTELEGERVTIRCDGDRIAAIGPAIEGEPSDEVIDGTGTAAVPGLVNAHTHAAMTLFRGYADDLPLMEWLSEHIWPNEAKLEAEDVYWGTRLACLEMIRTGTVRFWDMYWFPEAVARAVADAGLRAHVAAPLIDGERSDEARERTLEAIDAVAGTDAARVEVGFAPHAIYTVGPDSLAWVAEEADRRGAAVQIHLSETEGEVSDCLAEHGVRPAFHLDAAGLLGSRTLLGHGVWLDDAELELIADRGATVVTNPVANMKLAVGGGFPYPAAKERGVELGIGTDGPGSNNSLDLFSDLKTFALAQKNAAKDASLAPAAETLALARGELSSALRSPSLTEGAPADFLLVRADGHELALGSLDAGLAYAASGSIVHTTVVAGRGLMRDGEIDGAEEVIRRAQECAARIGVR